MNTQRFDFLVVAILIDNKRADGNQIMLTALYIIALTVGS